MNFDSLKTPIPEFSQVMLNEIEQQTVEDVKKEVAPLVFVLRGGEPTVVCFDDFNLETKHAVGDLLPILADRSDAVIFLTEAWMSRLDPERDKAQAQAMTEGQAPLIPPRLDLNRTEAVMVTLYLPGGRRLIWMAPISMKDGQRTRADFEFMGDTADQNAKNFFKPMRFE
jgi:hypothetical protein